MTAGTEGSFLVDGLIEGPLPECASDRKKIQDWSVLMGRTGIPMSLELDGGRFSLLPDPSPLARGSVGTAPARTLRESLQQLLDGLPPPCRSGVFSTLRSTLVGAGFEIQTAYLVGRDGKVEIHERTVEAETTAAQAHGRGRQHGMLLGMLGLSVLLVSSFFVDYRTLVRSLWSSLTPLSAGDISVDAGTFKPWLAVRIQGVRAGSRDIAIEIARTPQFPDSPSEIESALSAPGLALEARLALGALATGYVRCELFDDKGAFIDTATLRVRELATMPSVVRTVGVPSGRKLRSLVLAP